MILKLSVLIALYKSVFVDNGDDPRRVGGYRGTILSVDDKDHWPPDDDDDNGDDPHETKLKRTKKLSFTFHSVKITSKFTLFCGYLRALTISVERSLKCQE